VNVPEKAWPAALTTTRDEAEALLGRALELEAGLTLDGVYPTSPVPGMSDVDRMMRTEPVLQQIAASADWLRRQHIVDRINRTYGSYAYKHRVEYFMRTKFWSMYVEEGAFIAAAIGSGIKYELGRSGARQGTVSVFFCIRMSTR
jgi:hypothetical protein